MTALEVRLQDDLLGGEVLVGTLSKRSGRTGEAIDFEYASEWLRRRGPIRAFALDLDLPMAPGKHYARTGASELSGAFQDCSPDRWGSLLMQRRELIEAKEQGRQPAPCGLGITWWVSTTKGAWAQSAYANRAREATSMRVR